MAKSQSGEQNGRATLTDGEVTLLRDLAESERHLPPRQRWWTYQRLAETFEVSRAHVEKLVRGKRR